MFCYIFTIMADGAWVMGAAPVLLSEVHGKTGAELLSKCIMGRNLGIKQTSQIPPYNTIHAPKCV